MNYDHFNASHEYWRTKIYPYLTKKFNISAFDAYLKEMTFLPSCKWMKNFEEYNITLNQLAVDPEQFVKKYETNCITFYKPIRPEDGYYRFIHQISPTLHVESVLYTWMENNKINGYILNIICYKTVKEFDNFVAELETMKMSGDTQLRDAPGFSINQKVI